MGTPASKPPYRLVGEATPKAAFLTGKNGNDLAAVYRCQPEDGADAQWQQIINLLNAAPEMLAALRPGKELDRAYDRLSEAVEDPEISLGDLKRCVVSFCDAYLKQHEWRRRLVDGVYRDYVYRDRGDTQETSQAKE